MSRLLTVLKNFSKDSSYVTYESSSGTLSLTLSCNFSTVSNFEYELECVRLHLTGTAPTTSENFTITLDATRGTMYDIVLCKEPMVGVTDLLWSPEKDQQFAKDDQLVFAWTNSDVKEYGLAVRYRRLT